MNISNQVVVVLLFLLISTTLVGCAVQPTYVVNTQGKVVAVVYPPSPVQVHISTGNGYSVPRYYREERRQVQVVPNVRFTYSYRRDVHRSDRHRDRHHDRHNDRHDDDRHDHRRGR